MFKLSDDSFETFGKGLQIAFEPQASASIHFYKPDVLQSASRPSNDFATSAPLPSAVSQITVPFGPAADAA